MVRWMVVMACVLAGCSSNPEGKEWLVGEGENADMGTLADAQNNAVSAENNVSRTPGTTGTIGTTEPTERVIPRAGASEGSSCEVTLDCAEGLECTDVAGFEEAPELRCAAPSCFCDDPATTYCVEGDCALADRNCVLDGCPDDFECVGKVCRCDGSECAGGCQGDEHCSWDEMCVEGACREARCESDDECPARYVCGAGQLDRLCRIAGDGAVGDDCSRDSDCSTGYCYDGVTCVKPCMENAECGDRECATPDHFDLAVPYCQAPRCGACEVDEFCQVDQCATDPCPDGECSWGDI